MDLDLNTGLLAVNLLILLFPVMSKLGALKEWQENSKESDKQWRENHEKADDDRFKAIVDWCERIEGKL